MSAEIPAFGKVSPLWQEGKKDGGPSSRSEDDIGDIGTWQQRLGTTVNREGTHLLAMSVRGRSFLKF